MRALDMGSQGADISLWELLPFLACCLQLSVHWLLTWEASPENRTFISVSFVRNKLSVSCIYLLFVWITSSSGHTLQGSRIPWVLWITVSVLLGRCWMYQMNSLSEKLCWKSQWEAVVLGWFNHWHCSGTADMEEDAAQAQWKVSHAVIHSGYCDYHQQIQKG